MNWSNSVALHARDRHLRLNQFSLGTLAWALQSRERSALSTTIRNMILNDELIKSCGTARERPRPRVESHLLRDSSVGIQIQRERSALDSTIRNMTLNNEQIKSSGTARERPRPQVESHPPRDSSVGTPIQRERSALSTTKRNMILNNY